MKWERGREERQRVKGIMEQAEEISHAQTTCAWDSAFIGIKSEGLRFHRFIIGEFET